MRMRSSRRLISNFFLWTFIIYIYQKVYPMDDDKNKGFKGSYKASLVHRKPRPFYTNSIAGSRLPAVVEKC